MKGNVRKENARNGWKSKYSRDVREKENEESAKDERQQRT